MESPNDLIAQANLTLANSCGERKAALEMLNRHPNVLPPMAPLTHIRCPAGGGDVHSVAYVVDPKVVQKLPSQYLRSTFSSLTVKKAS